MRSSTFYSIGKRVGDAFTDLYFSLPRERQREWDEKRVAHHGALGYLVAAGALSRMKRARAEGTRATLEAAFALGLGLAESDLHDQDRWWTEGRIFEKARAADSADAGALDSP